MSLQVSRLMVDLDCLLDTRLATIASLDQDIALKLLKGNYLEREHDEFDGIDKGSFQERYNSRDRTILRNALRTPMVRFVGEFVLDTILQTTNSPFHFEPKVIINIFPYRLADSEKEIIKNTIGSFIDQRCEIDIVSLSNEEITPRFAKNNLSLLIKYDAIDWIEIHSQNENFKKVTCPEVTLIGPAFFLKGPPKPHELEKLKLNDLDPMQTLEMLAGPLVSLKLLPIDTFSIAF